MTTLLLEPQAHVRRNDRWLWLAIAASAIAHIALLTRPAGEPTAGTTRVEQRVQVTLAAPVPPPAKEEPADPAATAPASSPAKPATSSAPTTDSTPNDAIDWRQQARDIIASSQPARSPYEAPPLENHRFGKESEEVRIPGLAEAFRPLNRDSEICGSEQAFEVGDLSVVMPVARPCTREEKNEELRGRRSPP